MEMSDISRVLVTRVIDRTGFKVGNQAERLEEPELADVREWLADQGLVAVPVTKLMRWTSELEALNKQNEE
jgi:hypothetical protein